MWPNGNRGGHDGQRADKQKKDGLRHWSGVVRAPLARSSAALQSAKSQPTSLFLSVSQCPDRKQGSHIRKKKKGCCCCSWWWRAHYYFFWPFSTGHQQKQHRLQNGRLTVTRRRWCLLSAVCHLVSMVNLFKCTDLALFFAIDITTDGSLARHWPMLSC